MYKVPSVNVKVERCSTLMLKRDTSYITSILLAHVKITRQWKSTHNGQTRVTLTIYYSRMCPSS